ncbi:MAG: peptidase S10 [bacterium]|nr:peptidase S10 [bacterium]
MKRALSLLMLAALAATVAPVRAASEAPKAPSPPTAAPSEPGVFPDSVTEHVVTIDGKPIHYTARAGLITLHDQQNVPTARVFYTAYTVDGANPMTQPVTFLYNGGPGSSTMWLRMGSVGPVRVLAADGQASGPPPYRIEDNPYSLLDKSDLVFIDMPDSGFGRNMPGKERLYFGVDQDVAAFGQFIENYISQFGRWNSPKFLFGESYGTTRSAALSDYLLNHGVALNGVVLQSSILNFGLDFTSGNPIGGGDWPYVLYLPTEAATAWYHHKVANAPADLGTFVKEVDDFALGEYLDALYRGDKISASERNDVVRKLSRYLGVSPEYVRESNLRIPYTRYQSELLRPEGEVFGRLDSRYTTTTTDRASYEGPQWDPTDSSIDAPYTTAINQYLREDLKYNPPIPYRANIYGIIYGEGKSWDFAHNGQYPTNVAPDLADAMTQNPRLHVFSANGYYDFATPFFATQYTLEHLNIASSLQNNISFGFYPAGHMIYLSTPALAQYKADLARWYDSVLGR